MTELLEVQKMLELKSKQLLKREQDLKARESQLENTRQKMLQTIREECRQLFKE